MSIEQPKPRRRSKGEKGATGAERSADEQLAELRQRLEEAEETIAAIQSGAVDAFIIQEDGTDRVYTLQGADRPYRMLVECMPEGALLLGRDGLVLFANRRMAAMARVPHEKLVGAPFQSLVVPEDRPAWDRLLAAGRREESRAELHLKAGDDPLPVLLSASPLPMAGQNALCLVVTDLTSERAHRELEQGHTALRHSEEQLRIADRKKDEFLATLAHELRNPLAPVRSLLEVLRLKGGDSPDLEWARGVIERQVMHMARMVDDLVDLTRIANGRMEVQRVPVDLVAAVEAAIARVAPLARDAGHDVQLEAPRAMVVVQGDAGRLTQVFANLLSNAVRFTPRFGAIRVAVTVEHGAARVAVTDNGDGIPDAVRPHVFEMFNHLGDAVARHPQAGLGVGLSLVRQLVALHGGAVDFRSGDGQGTTFTVELPVVDDAAAVPVAAAGSLRGGAAEGLRVLIVDDNVDAADALATMLRLGGHDVRTAYDGRGCLAIGTDFEPQVVLLDVAMPGLNGYEICQRIRGTDWGPRAHVVAVTGWGAPEDRRRSTEEGFDHHLVKPVDPAVLADLMHQLATPRRAPFRHV